MSKPTERRFVSSVELRSTTRGGKPVIEGYAATFNTPFSKPMQKALGFVETIAPGAFSRAIRERQDVICTQDHKPELLLGRCSNGTLRLAEDRRGLLFSCDLPDTSVARDLQALIQRKDISGCSFGFIPVKEKWGKPRDNGNLQATRELQDVDLLDVSCVAQPAYDLGTEVNSRGDEWDDCEDDDACEEKSLQEVEHNSLLNALFPSGQIPMEVRSHLRIGRRKSGILTVSDTDRLRMAMKLKLAKVDL